MRGAIAVWGLSQGISLGSQRRGRSQGARRITTTSPDCCDWSEGSRIIRASTRQELTKSRRYLLPAPPDTPLARLLKVRLTELRQSSPGSLTRDPHAPRVRQRPVRRSEAQPTLPFAPWLARPCTTEICPPCPSCTHPRRERRGAVDGKTFQQISEDRRERDRSRECERVGGSPLPADSVESQRSR